MDEKENSTLEQEDGLSLRDIFFIIRKHLIAIFCILICFTAFGYGYSKLQPKEYRSTGTMLVSLDDNSSTSTTSRYQFSTYISDTFVSFLSLDVVLTEASNELKGENVTISPREIKKGMSASLINDTLFIGVSYISQDAELSPKVVDAVMNAAIKISNEYRVDEQGNVVTDKDGNPVYKYILLKNNLAVMDEAKKSTLVSHTMKNMVIFFAVGLVIAVAYVSLREIFDTSFKSKSEVERYLGIPVLAGVPCYELKDEEKGGK